MVIEEQLMKAKCKKAQVACSIAQVALGIRSFSAALKELRDAHNIIYSIIRSLEDAGVRGAPEDKEVL